MKPFCQGFRVSCSNKVPRNYCEALLLLIHSGVLQTFPDVFEQGGSGLECLKDLHLEGLKKPKKNS